MRLIRERRSLAVWCYFVFLVTAAGPAEPSQATGPQTESRIAPVGDVRLPQVTPFVLVHDPATGQLGLYQVGEAIFAGDNPLPVGKVASIEPRSLWLALPSGVTVQVSEGSKIPGPQTLIFVRSAWLDSLRFQLRFGGAAASKNYSVVGIQGRRAILERVAAPGEDATKAGLIAVLGSSESSGGPYVRTTSLPTAETSPLADMLNRIPFAEVAPNTWEVPGRSLNELGDYMWPLLAETLRSARPTVDVGWGVGLKLDTSLASGTLDRGGFTIDYVRLARRTGLEVGDRILSVNDQPVNSAGSLVRLYRELSSDGSVSEVKVMIRRAGEQRTITYRLR